MTHQVNLNKKNLLPGFGPVQLPTFIIVIIAALFISAGWVAFAWYERQVLLTAEQEWIANAQSDLAALNNFQNQFPDMNDEQSLIAENTQLTTQLQRTRETYSGLADQMENAVEGFHASLLQLSDYDVDGLWLDHITLQDGNRYFMLRGVSRSPDLIPLYLDQLGSSSFRGISIDSLSVSKQQGQSQWQFSLSNTSKNITGGNL